MKLLVFDVEGTIFKTKIRLPGTNIDSTIWQSIAHCLGPSAIQEEVETHLKWETGLYNSYIEWMEATIKIHKSYGLTSTLFNDIINSAEYNCGVDKFFKHLNRNKYIPVLISGGFQNLACRAQIDLGINHSFSACQYFFDNTGYLKAYNLLPCDFDGKIDFVQILLKEYNINENDWIFIGDGKNDVPIAKKSPISIGFNPHNELSKVVDYIINDFRELLKII